MKKLLSRVGALAFLLFLIVVFITGVLFHAHNSGSVTIDLYVRTIQTPVSYLVVGAMIIGACLGWLAALFPLLVMQGRLHALKRRQSLTEKELEALRTLPFRDAD